MKVRKLKTNKDLNETTLTYGVSVIICCFNSAKTLPQTLAHLRAQKIDKNILWEILIVDNNSTDETVNIALEFSSKNTSIALRVVKEPQQGLSYARHKGLSEAKYEFCAFIDDDNWAYPDWVNRCFQIMQNHPEVGACGGFNEVEYYIPTPKWLKKEEASYGIGPQADKEGYISAKRGYLWGAGLVFRKSSWKTLVNKGFCNILTGRTGEEILSGEDEELTLALRLTSWKLWYCPKLKLKHFLPSYRLEWKYLCYLSRSFGKASVFLDFYRYFLKHNKNITKQQLIGLCLLTAIKIFFLYVIVHIKTILFTTKESRNKLRLNFSLGRFYEFIKLFQAKGKYAQITTMLSSLKKD